MRIIFTRVIFPNLPPHMVKNLFQIIHFELKLMLFRLKGSWTAEFKSKRRSKLCFSLKLKIKRIQNTMVDLRLGSKLTQKNEILIFFCPRIFEKLQKEIQKYTVGYLPEKWEFWKTFFLIGIRMLRIAIIFCKSLVIWVKITFTSK